MTSLKLCIVMGGGAVLAVYANKKNVVDEVIVLDKDLDQVADMDQSVFPSVDDILTDRGVVYPCDNVYTIAVE